MTTIEITARDPVIARDGRPFGAGQGNRMRSLDWPQPSMVAGSLRSTLGKAAGRDFSKETTAALQNVEIAGLFPVLAGHMYLPAPQDCIITPDHHPIRLAPDPTPAGGGDWPFAGLRPVQPVSADIGDFKPAEAPAWWPAERYAAWLAGEPVGFDESFLRAAMAESRTHASPAPDTGAMDEGQLFTTVGLILSHLPRYQAGGSGMARFAPIAMTTRVRATGWCDAAAETLDRLHPLGGERRLVRWHASATVVGWTCPDRVGAALGEATRVRMTLTTAAIFGQGWQPGWLDANLVGRPPGAEVVLRLVGASIARWRAVSGWSLAPPRGPKPVRRVVPAGGVYFFEIVEGRAVDLTASWLESVSDEEQDRRDGFGLAAWGVW